MLALWSGVQCKSVRRLVAVALLALTSHGQQPSFKSGIDLVKIGAVVMDKRGNLVTNLLPSDFELFEDGKQQSLTNFARGEDEASLQPELHLGLMLDVSESMSDDLAFTKTAAIKFLNRLTDAKDVTVVDFDTEVRAARYSQAEFARLIERIRAKKVGGFTAIYDAVALYLDGAGGLDGRKIMLLYTDGGDTRSTLTFAQLVDLLKASDVTIYVIGMLEHQSSFSKNEQRTTILQIAETTGGEALFPTSAKQLDEMYDKVLAQIRAQYTLGYMSTNPQADGKWRRVEIRMRKDDRGLKVRARKGYFAALRR